MAQVSVTSKDNQLLELKSKIASFEVREHIWHDYLDYTHWEGTTLIFLMICFHI